MEAPTPVTWHKPPYLPHPSKAPAKPGVGLGGTAATGRTKLSDGVQVGKGDPPAGPCRGLRGTGARAGGVSVTRHRDGWGHPPDQLSLLFGSACAETGQELCASEGDF